MKKYILTDETKEWNGKTLHRIQAVRDFRYVVKGDLGGWIESESNLSHDGYCWVDDEAMVMGNAQVYNDGLVLDEAIVDCNAKIYEHGVVIDEAYVTDNVEVYGAAAVMSKATVEADVKIFEYATVGSHAQVYGSAKVYGHGLVTDFSEVYGEAEIFDYATVCDHQRINSKAKISSCKDIFYIRNIGGQDDTLTFFKTEDGVSVIQECYCGTLFTGSLEEFEKTSLLEKFENAVVRGEDYNSKYEENYQLAIKLAKAQLCN